MRFTVQNVLCWNFCLVQSCSNVKYSVFMDPCKKCLNKYNYIYCFTQICKIQYMSTSTVTNRYLVKAAHLSFSIGNKVYHQFWLIKAPIKESVHCCPLVFIIIVTSDHGLVVIDITLLCIKTGVLLLGSYIFICLETRKKTIYRPGCGLRSLISQNVR